MSDHGDRAVGYVRVSTLRQAEEGNSIASQTLSLQRYARNRGLRLRSKDIVIDDGVSGVSAGKAQRAVGYIRSAVQIWEQMVDLDVEVTEDL